MEGSAFLLVLAVCVIIGLFVTLFLQGAYVRYRLSDLERSRMSNVADIDAVCSDISSGIRSYALKVSCCKTNELNAGNLRRPTAITTGSPLPPDNDPASRDPTCRWLALSKTTAARELHADVASGRVKYLVTGGQVHRIALPNLHEYFTDGERVQLNSSYVLLSVAYAFPPEQNVVLPWQGQMQTASQQSPDDFVSGICDGACTAGKDAVAVHAWAYGVTSAAVS